MNSSNCVALVGKCNTPFITRTCILAIIPSRSVWNTNIFAVMSRKPIFVSPTGIAAKCSSKCGSRSRMKKDSGLPVRGSLLKHWIVGNKPKGWKGMAQYLKSAPYDFNIHFYAQAPIHVGASAHLQTYLLNQNQKKK